MTYDRAPERLSMRFHREREKGPGTGCATALFAWNDKDAGKSASEGKQNHKGETSLWYIVISNVP